MHILKFFLSDEPPFDQRFRLAKDATLPEINVQVFDEPGLAKDLTGATVTFTMTDVNGVEKIAAVAANLDVASTGSISYDWVAADVDSDAVYEGKFDITVGALKFTVPNGTTQRLIISTGNAEGLALALASTTGFADGGEGRGKNRTLGNTDNFALGFITNDIIRQYILGDGKVAFGPGFITPTAPVHVRDTLNGNQDLLVENLSTGASAFARLIAQNDTGSYVRVLVGGSGSSFANEAVISRNGVIVKEIALSLAGPTTHRFYIDGLTDSDEWMRSAVGAVVFNEDGVDRDFRIKGDTDPNLFFVDASTDRVGVRTATPTGQVHIDQPSLTGAIPVLKLDQADLSEEMFEFVSTIGVGNPIEAVAAKTLTTTHFVRISIPGFPGIYFPCGTIS